MQRIYYAWFAEPSNHVEGIHPSVRTRSVGDNRNIVGNILHNIITTFVLKDNKGSLYATVDTVACTKMHFNSLCSWCNVFATDFSVVRKHQGAHHPYYIQSAFHLNLRCVIHPAYCSQNHVSNDQDDERHLFWVLMSSRGSFLASMFESG